MRITATELLTIARKERPNVRYSLNRKQNCLAAWSNDMGRYVIVACMLLTGEWVEVPRELLVNDKPMVPASEWVDPITDTDFNFDS